jgi:hypothetical protein
MNPAMFPEVNRIFKGPPNSPDVGELPLWTNRPPDGANQVADFVSCWSPSIKERIQIFLFGKVWLHVRSYSHPPVYIDGNRVYFADESDA